MKSGSSFDILAGSVSTEAGAVRINFGSGSTIPSFLVSFPTIRFKFSICSANARVSLTNDATKISKTERGKIDQLS